MGVLAYGAFVVGGFCPWGFRPGVCVFPTLNTYIAVENIVRKVEIACNKRFLLFSCFLPYIWYLFSILNAL